MAMISPFPRTNPFRISWFGGYLYGNADYSVTPPPVASEGLEFAFFKKTTTSTPVATFLTVPLARVDTGVTFAGNSTVKLYSYTAALPSLALSAGDYILTISAQPHALPYYWVW